MVLGAAQADKPKLRYLTGDDLILLAKTKKSISDEGFHDILKQF